MSDPPAPLASTRTLTRYFVGFDVEMMLNYLQPVDGGKRKADVGEVYLASEVDPLLTALAQQDEEIKKPKDEPDFWRCRSCGCLWRDNHDETVSLASAKQTSCVECEMKGSAEACEPLFTAVQFINNQIVALTARAEAADTLVETLRAEVRLQLEARFAAEASVASLREALDVVAQGKGPFSRDPLTHAGNCIDAMKTVAEAALRAVPAPPEDTK